MVDIYLTENLGSLTKAKIPLFKNIPNDYYHDKNLELQFEFDQHNYVWVNPCTAKILPSIPVSCKLYNAPGVTSINIKYSRL